MKKTIAVLSLAISLCVWCMFTWPLPKHLFNGIPFSGHHMGDRTEVMLPGDHLQFLYHFWLVSDMIAGKTPAFSNLYEFNVGDDSARHHLDPHFFPFSFIYTLGAKIGGRAFGYNATGFLATWLTYLLTWLLVRRYCSSQMIAGIAALVSILVPYRWYSIMGGSPAGLTMLWIPMIMLGVDIAVREGKIAGGVLAGLGILCASLSDSHVFFFGTIAAPIWCVIAFSRREDFRWSKAGDYLKLALALLPVPLLLGVSFLMTRHTVERVGKDAAAGIRSIEEVAIFSPRWNDFFLREQSAQGNQIYMGYVITAVIAAGLAALLLYALRDWKARWRPLLTAILCVCAMLGILCLVVGPYGPFEGKLFVGIRKFIPPYKMIRQTAKAFCLMPFFLSLAMTISLTALTQWGGRWWKALLPIVACALVLVEYHGRLRGGICILQEEQGAYGRVVEDAAARQVVPRALIITLWPGDSSPSSLYEYYVSLYRLRMANGYSPILPKGYKANFFFRYESVNQGYLDDGQLNSLLKSGVNYLLLHEDQFPETISAFPITFTLKNLLNNPRIALLGRFDNVWAFRILDEPEKRETVGDSWNVVFPARRWEAEKCVMTNLVVMSDASASAGQYLAARLSGAFIETPSNSVTPAQNLRYMVRVRGIGDLRAEFFMDDRIMVTRQFSVRSDDWTWQSIAFPAFEGHRCIKMRLSTAEGQLDVDNMLLTAGEWEWDMQAGQSVSIPAPCFFHAGHIDLGKNSVFLEAGKRSGTMFYGPKLPVAKGRYRVELIFATAAPSGADAGELIVDQCEDKRIGKVAVVTGKPACIEFYQLQNLGINIVFSFSGKIDLDIEKVVISRLE